MKKKEEGIAQLELTEEEIDEILDRFIARYLSEVQPIARGARSIAIGRLRDFLRERDFDDFKNAEEFAERLLEELAKGFGAGWAGVRERRAIARVVRGVYEFYRLRDLTPFGGVDPPVRLRFGGPDRRSIEFLSEFDHFYFSKFGGNTDRSLKRFFIDRYFEDGAALFGRESTEEIEDFRRAAGEKLGELNDQQINTIVRSAVQRVRNWAHIGSLSQAGIEKARVVATLDERTTEICRELDGKIIRVAPAQEAIEELIGLEPGEVAARLYESPLGKAISRDPVGTIKGFIEGDGKTIKDELVRMGRGFPPYHPNCRTRLEGLIEGIDEDA